MDVESVFGHTPTAVRFVLGVMFVLGLIGLGVGIYIDTEGLWGGLSFVPNIVTSAVSFCIGLPFAFFIVAAVVESRTRSMENARVEGLTAREWNRFGESLGTLSPERLRLTLKGCRDLKTIFQANFPKVQDAVGRGADQDFRDASRALADLIDEALGDVRQHLFPSAARNIVWQQIIANWDYQHRELRSRRDDLDLPGLSEEVVTLTTDLLQKGDQSWDELYEALFGARKGESVSGVRNWLVLFNRDGFAAFTQFEAANIGSDPSRSFVAASKRAKDVISQIDVARIIANRTVAQAYPVDVT